MTMTKILPVIASILLAVALMAFSMGGDEPPAHTSTGGAPWGHSGDPGNGSLTCKACHSGPAAITQAGMITTNIPPSGYIANTTYTITATIVRPGHSRFGFQATPQDPSGALVGTLGNISGTQILNPGAKYITHVTGSSTGSGSKTWNFLWTAPAPGSGSVTFYSAFNAANNNAQATGDTIFVSTLTLTEDPLSAVEETEENISGISAYPNPASGSVYIRMKLEEPSAVEIDLLSLTGSQTRLFYSETETGGEFSRAFSLSHLPAGVYLLRVKTNEKQRMRRLVKI